MNDISLLSMDTRRFARNRHSRTNKDNQGQTRTFPRYPLEHDDDMALYLAVWAHAVLQQRQPVFSFILFVEWELW